ncbi:fiber [Bat mastadenovirus WIV11]|uniref:Fiber n=1 Tax=Bat mastadenovirus WIV11 TaxID=1788433 RepID=A0A163HLD2_9ADEN|nr:fiber [Bat mastadenovirus WIV11]AMB43135.1 fiber [Bat mastadenovirus WIV11]
MKRAASFNPVYPFEEQTQPNTALPPFFSSDGLEEKPGGTLGLKITNPLGFDLDGNLKLKLGDGMRIDVNGALENTQTLTADNPLEISNHDVISLKYNSSSVFVNGSGELDIIHQQTLTAENPIAIEDERIKLKTDATLSTNSSGQLHLNLHASAPIVLQNQNVIQLNTDTNGLKIENNLLKLNIAGSTLFFNQLHELEVSYDVLWTGAGVEANAAIKSDSPNAHIDLVLAKVGPMVHGKIKVTPLGGPINANITQANLECYLKFNNNGVLQGGSSSLKSLYYKNGVHNAEANVDNVRFMPSVAFYPRYNKSQNSDNQRVYDRILVANRPQRNDAATANINFVMQIQYNAFYSTPPASDYSILFTFSNFDSSENYTGLWTGWGNFSYLTQQ